jgi:hypothetical protein
MASRPGRVAEEFDIGRARPRDLATDDAQALMATLRDRLHREVRRHADG